MSNIFLSTNDLALIREALDDLAWDLDTRADEFHHARPDDALSAREQQISEDQNAVKRLLAVLPDQGPVTICPEPDTDGQVAA